MSDYLINEAIHYALEENEIVINYIEGDGVKRIIKDVDFYYNGTKYFITLEVINNGKNKEYCFHKYSSKVSLSSDIYFSFKDIIGIDNNEINETINIMMELSDFTDREKQMVEVIKTEFLKKKKP